MAVLLTVCGLVVVVLVFLKIYAKVTSSWCRSQTCLVGKTAIVTGSNTGTGFETALDFAKRGARVILACRNEQRAEEARKKIVEQTGNGNVVVKLVDLSSFDSVRAFAKDVNATEERLDILVNNAGVFGIGDIKTEDGLLLVMQTNHFSSFLLTNLLIGLMKKSQSARIVSVSSLSAKYIKQLDLKKINEFSSAYTLYAHSKLCNILFTMELAKKLEGTRITTYSVHPGAVQTEVMRYVKNVAFLILDFLFSMYRKTSEEGAQTIIYCSVVKGLEKYNGEHFAECHRDSPYKTATVPGLPGKLWKLSEEMVHLKPEELQF